MAKHIEDFLDLSFGKLNFFLQQRVIPVGGNHQFDLAGRALVAFAQNIPVKHTEDCAKDLRHEHSYPACLLINFSTKSTTTEVLSQRYNELH